MELENWINSIHSACAAAFARHRGKTGTLHLLQEDIFRLERSIESVSAVCLDKSAVCWGVSAVRWGLSAVFWSVIVAFGASVSSIGASLWSLGREYHLLVRRCGL